MKHEFNAGFKGHYLTQNADYGNIYGKYTYIIIIHYYYTKYFKQVIQSSVRKWNFPK